LNIKTKQGKMPQNKKVLSYSGTQLPLFVEKDEDGFYVVECPLFEGCYTQGKTLDHALKNIREVIKMVLEEKDNLNILRSYRPREISLHTITL
jgi:predicted RNase H-like HicB family nuclease